MEDRKQTEQQRKQADHGETDTLKNNKGNISTKKLN